MSTEIQRDEVASRICREVLAELRDATPRRAGSTYRLQMHGNFRMVDATSIVGYLHDLGITDLYLSPCLDARPGSTHGYDVFDHSQINPEIGTEDDHARLIAALAEHSMGRVLDIVPNHMGINGPNPFWIDVLQMGPHSRFARFFDIDWHPVKPELNGRVLLPILGSQYGEVLESGQFRLHRDHGDFSIVYGENQLPLATRSLAVILEIAAESVSENLDEEAPELLEFFSIWESASRLPLRSSNRPEDIEHRLRERHIIPRRISHLCQESPAIARSIDQAISVINGTPGNSQSYDSMHRLLEEQYYRLAHWRVASQEINYRRFFDINDLAGLRAEDPKVFSVIHARIFEWVAQGGIHGLRIDHPDGLADPAGYFQDLQDAIFLIRCRNHFEEDADHPREWQRLAPRILARYHEAMAESPDRQLAFPVVAEKILSGDEQLPDAWPIDGTVGYEYLNALNGLFVDSTAEAAIHSTYEDFTNDREPFNDLLYRSKMQIVLQSLASEINVLARQLNRVSEQDRRSRDFTHDDLRTAIREVVACFPVYRTYVRPSEPVADRDRQYIEQAINEARERATSLDASLFDFLRSLLLLEDFPEMTDRGRVLRNAFVIRFQQTTGPTQAKGLEDTVFYRRVPLLSLNEVGGEPQHFGTSPDRFHAMNLHRLNHWPGGLSTTATHDTKRGEDARIRINVISELPDLWRSLVTRWRPILQPAKTRVGKRLFPDMIEEFLFYQALVGIWPLDSKGDQAPEGLVERMQEYLIKATREAKRNTSWTDPNPAYPNLLKAFVEESLRGACSEAFLAEFLPFQRRVARVGVVHSLAQAVLKVASPGIPDVYQGCEMWDFSLVDPDNRRPVDYERRAAGLKEIADRLASSDDRSGAVAAMLAESESGLVKQFVLATALKHRRDNSDLYSEGRYVPLHAEGEHGQRIVAFLRRNADAAVLVVAPRLVTPLMGDDGLVSPTGSEIWGDTRLILDGDVPRGIWKDLITNRRFDPGRGDQGSLAIGDLFASFPLAMLQFQSST